MRPTPKTTHRIIQLSEINDRASSERVSYYCRAIKASSIGNGGAARFFTAKAQKWERIRIRSARALLSRLGAA